MKNPESRGVICFRPISPFYTKFQRVPVAKDGVMCFDSQFVEYSAKEDITSLDYSLGNLISIGADKSLTYVSMSVNSDMNFVDDFAKSYSNVSEIDK